MRSLTRLAVMGALAAGHSVASAAEYRLLTTADGRQLACEILATESRGLRVSLPQGEMLVPFTLLRDMVPIEAAQFRSSPQWQVFIAPTTAFREPLLQAVRGMSGVQVFGEEGAQTDITPDQAHLASECGEDLTCVAQKVEGNRFVWVLSVDEDGTVRGLLSPGGTANSTTPASVSPNDLFRAAGEVMEVTPKGGPAAGPVATVKPGPREPKAPRVREPGVDRSAWVPLPGYPSLKAGDMGSFATSWAVVLPATALWVGAAAHSTDNNLPGTALIGLGGYYALTVVTNQMMSQSTKTALTVLPVADGQGAMLAFHANR